MEFRLELKVKPFEKQIRFPGPVMLVGSCFTDHISERLAAHKFQVLENPFGILFNPRSIENALQAAVSGKIYTRSDLFLHNELWHSWDHHGSFSHPDPDLALGRINQLAADTANFISNTEWVIITLGSAWVYELQNDTYGGRPGQVTANCHKVPQQHFNHRLLGATETRSSLDKIVQLLRQAKPGIRVIFTISPVRHHREGLVENNRSKSRLVTAVHELVETGEALYYFPSYELVIDDLRDYRFYAEDLVHPNYQATRYVWEKFSEACIEEESRKLMAEIHKVVHARSHRSLHPASAPHQRFLSNMLERTRHLQQQFPGIDFSAEAAAFSAGDLQQ